MDNRRMNITAEQAARSHEDKSDIALGVAVGLMVWGLVLVTIRLCCRRIIRSMGWDDLFVVMGLVSIACYWLDCQYVLQYPTPTLLTGLVTMYGLGKHDWTLTPDQLILYGRVRDPLK
ncbi:unnamed protein product [Fusarium equiseti]|uniref:Uncharacterized protein n=1 Tax=Fusarium equiseti TaxID=61235 RepID=A0A8J2JCK1_FUSEQ|nr:unnamed protein product [Fusarium equiseti]